MKLVIAVVQGEDATQTVQALSGAGISVTKMASSGGFLQQRNATLLIGVDDDKVEAAIEVIRVNCRERAGSVEVMMGEFDGWSRWAGRRVSRRAALAASMQ